MELTDIIPAASIMIASVAASTTGGAPLDDTELAKVLHGCDMALSLDDCRKKVRSYIKCNTLHSFFIRHSPIHSFTSQILEYVESRMVFIAPNLSALVGSSVAAKLIAAAGGLTSLSKIPACNLILLGAPKKNLGGFSTAQSKRFMTGCISMR